MSQIIGIDFGTTNSVVSFFNNRSGRITALRPLLGSGVSGDTTIPTAVYYLDSDDFCIGEEALQRGVVNPRGLVTGFKVDLGQKKRYDVVTDKGDEIEISPGQATRHFFSKLIKMYEKKLAINDTADIKAVVTVPAKFTPAQKNLIKKEASGVLAQDTVIAAEPTAAAAKACYEKGISDRTVLIYDFGGGTFDVSVMEAKAKINSLSFTEIVTGGSKSLGGNDITAVIAQEIADEISSGYGLLLPTDDEKTGKYRILDQCDYEENRLSYDEYYKNMVKIFDYAEEMKLYFNNGGINETFDAPLLNFCIGNNRFEDIADLSFEKQEIDDLIRDKVEETIKITRRVFDSAKSNNADIDEIVLVGGSSHLSLVYEKLEKEFPNVEITISDDCENIISMGAVALAKNSLENIVQKTNCEYGIIGYHKNIPDCFVSMVGMGVTLPFTGSRVALLSYDNQTRLSIPIYEWDKLNYPKSTRRIHPGIEEIEEVQIDNLPPGLKKSDTQIKFTLTMNSDGSFDVSVEVLSGGNVIKADSMTVGKGSDLE